MRTYSENKNVPADQSSGMADFLFALALAVGGAIALGLLAVGFL